MGPKALRSTSSAVSVFASVLGLGACVGLGTPVDLASMLRPIEVASSRDPGVIRSEAQNGDGQAQLALWLVLSYGLGDVGASPVEAGLWRARALGSRGVIPITQYTAAFNGQPSRINIINVPRYDVPPVQLELIERCIAYLNSAIGDPSTCGGEERAQELSRLWRRSAD